MSFSDPQSVKLKVTSYSTGTADMFTINGVNVKSALSQADAENLDKNGLHILRLPGNKAPVYSGDTLDVLASIIGVHVSK